VCDDSGNCKGGCKPNFGGPKCDVKCSANCKNGCDANGLCIGGCNTGFYGTKCDTTC